MAEDEHPNVATVRQMFDAFSEGDHQGLAGVAEHLHHDASLHVDGDATPYAGRYEGRNDIHRALGAKINDSDGTWRLTSFDAYPAGDELVLVHLIEKAEVGGTEHEGHVGYVVRLIDGKVADVVRMADSALDAHWGAAAAPLPG